MVLVHFRAMSSWSHSCLHVSILFGYPIECHIRLHRGSIQFGNSYPDGRCHHRRWNLRIVLFHSEYPIELMDAPLMGVRNVLREAEKKMHGRSRSSPPSDCPDILLSPRSMHPSSFLVPPPSKSRDEIFFKGGGPTPRVTAILITFIRGLIRHPIHCLIKS
jgi:hypothetical protein